MLRILDGMLGQPWVWKSLSDHPARLAALRDRGMAWYLEHVTLPQTLATCAAGAGVAQAWAPPGTPPAEILTWFDNQIVDVPRTISVAFPLNQLRVIVACCSVDEWHAGVTDEALDLRADLLQAIARATTSWQEMSRSARSAMLG